MTLDRNGVDPTMLDLTGVDRIGLEDATTMLDLIGVNLTPVDRIGLDATMLDLIGVDATMFDLNGVPCLDKYGEARLLRS